MVLRYSPITKTVRKHSMDKTKVSQCAECGNIFVPRKASSKFCCRDCFKVFKRKNNTARCVECGKEFKRKKDRSKFCSVECYRVSQRRGEYKRGTSRAIPCSHCGVIVYGRTKSKRCEKMYCSRECYDAARAIVWSLRAGKCLFCGEQMSFAGVHAGRKYCSSDCRKKAFLGRSRNCVMCGCWFTPIKITASGNVNTLIRKTCSRECRVGWIKTNQTRKDKISAAFKGSKHPNWQGGKSLWNNISGRGQNWKTQRAKALKRDKGKCVDCGMIQSQSLEKYGLSLHVDHIVPFHNFTSYKKANVLSNLETRCASCHTKVEHKKGPRQMVLTLGSYTRSGHKSRGKTISRAKLTELDVLVILRNVGTVSKRDLAEKYGVGYSAIHNITKGKTWKHLSRPSESRA